MGNHCTSCFDETPTSANAASAGSRPPAGGLLGGGASAPTQMQEQAIEQLIADATTAGTDRIPTFDWKFRRGFGTVSIGPHGAERLANVMFLRVQSSAATVPLVDLSGQNILNSGAASVARWVERERHLTHLDLSRNSIDDLGCSSIATALSRSASLRSFWCEGNPLHSAGLTTLARAVRATFILQTFHVSVMSDTVLDDTAVVALSSLLATPSLTDLAFSGSGGHCLSAASLQVFFGALRGNTSLRQLRLHSCVAMTAASSLAPAVSILVRELTQPTLQLQVLDLRLPLSSECAGILANGLKGGVPRLRSLSLNGCYLESSGIAAIASALPSTLLERVDLGQQGNVVDDAAMIAVAGGVRKHPSLREVSILDLPLSAAVAVAMCEAVESATILYSLKHAPLTDGRIAERLGRALRLNEDRYRQSVERGATGGRSSHADGEGLTNSFGPRAVDASSKRDDDFVELQF